MFVNKVICRDCVNTIIGAGACVGGARVKLDKLGGGGGGVRQIPLTREASTYICVQGC